MAIQATELRIGNYVCENTYLNKIGAVTNIYSEDNTVTLLFDDNKYGDRDFSVEPIPLTEEWLERFEFDKGVSTKVDYVYAECDITQYPNECICYGVYKDGDEFTFNVCPSSYIGEENEWEGWRVLTYVKYVHQLQNLYFALTGEELQLKE